MLFRSRVVCCTPVSVLFILFLWCVLFLPLTVFILLVYVIHCENYLTFSSFVFCSVIFVIDVLAGCYLIYPLVPSEHYPAKATEGDEKITLKKH